MSFEQACVEIIKELKKSEVRTKHDFNRVKNKVLSKYSYVKRIPKNADIYFTASEEDRRKYKDILGIKPVRTISGVAPIALMSEPYPCPHTMKGIGPCTYCPGGPGSPFGDVPQSYTGKEPSTRRAMRNNYDPYFIVFNRLEHYVAMGKVPDKAEIIIQGGTFTFFPRSYQEYFVKYALKAMNDFSYLFFGNNGIFDIEKFKVFFELPKNIDEDERTKRINAKLSYIKQLDLGNGGVLNQIDNFIIENSKNENKKPGLQNQAIEPQVSSHPFTTKICGEVYKSFVSSDCAEPGWQKQALRLPQEQVGSHPSGFKTSIVEVPAPAHNNLDNTNIIINPENNKIRNKNIRNPNVSAILNLQQKLKQENNENIKLIDVQRQNENSFIRCVGLTIETKSDFGKLYHGNIMLELGCTRVEIGIQSVYDNVLEATNRGNTVADNIESIRILKDLGFKINAHYMPGLPFTTKKMDEFGLRQLFENPDYRPDMLKIYPCMVMPGTKLYEDWKQGKFNPLTTKEAAELIADFKRYIPTYCRIMRVQRDIPTNVTSSGVDRTNLRQYVEKLCIEKNIKCRCIRCREIGIFLRNNKNIRIDIEDIEIVVTQYDASKGKEFFISAEDVKNDVLFGFVRLRFPSQFLRDEITEGSALIRELHVFSSAVQIGKTSDDSFQHKGIGKMLMKKAEETAKQHNKNKIVIISGIGARNYFRKLGYELEGVYMVKELT